MRSTLAILRSMYISMKLRIRCAMGFDCVDARGQAKTYPTPPLRGGAWYRAAKGR